jgi:hypothetical protein
MLCEIFVRAGPANISQDSQNFSDIGFPSNRGLKIAHLNVRRITNKIDSLRLLLLNNPFDVLTISETWLTKNISDPELIFKVILLSGMMVKAKKVVDA